MPFRGLSPAFSLSARQMAIAEDKFKLQFDPPKAVPSALPPMEVLSWELPTSSRNCRPEINCRTIMVTSPASGISLRWPSTHDTIDTHAKR